MISRLVLPACLLLVICSAATAAPCKQANVLADDTGPNCVDDCKNVENGDYQSCKACDVYVTCSNGDITEDRPCAADLVWDDNTKTCEKTSDTCDPDPCKDKHIDVIFMMDESGSISSTDFDTLKDFVIDIIGELDIGDDKTRVGVITFDSYANTDITLPDNDNLVADINAIVQSGGGTNIANAINLMNTMFADDSLPENGMVGIVLTDGQSNGDVNGAVDNIDKDVLMISVGIGSNVDDEQLLIIAKDDPDHVLQVDDADALETILEMLPELICQ